MVVATFIVLVGVVLPAVWSDRPARRRDARRVIEIFFGRAGTDLTMPTDGK